MMILGLVFAYFFAGIPVGLLVGRMYGIADIRQHGSGNIGATNILRVIGWKAGLAVWVIDLLKGLIPVLVARHLLGLEGWGVGLAGLAATTGHCFSPFLGFTGGRGVSTSLGVVLGFFWPVGLLAFLVFVAVVKFTRYVSLGSMIGASSSALWVLVFSSMVAPYTLSYAVMAALCALVILYRHGPNIRRLLNGTEPKIGRKSQPEASAANGED